MKMNLLNLSDDKPEDDDPIIEALPVEPVIDDPQQRRMALIGAILMTVGVFMPIVRLPMSGSVNYFNNGTGDGIVVLLLAGVSFVLLGRRDRSALLVTGGLSLAVMLFTLLRLMNRISGIKDRVSRELADNPFRGIGEAMVSSVQIEWGWLPLIGGAVLLIVVGVKSKGPSLWSTVKSPAKKWLVIIIAGVLVFLAAAYAFTVIEVEGVEGLFR